MFPILRNGTNFSEIAILDDCVSCTVSEKLNGTYELKLEYPIDGNKADRISYDCVIDAKPNVGTGGQYFRVSHITKHHNHLLTITALHISYELNGLPVSVIRGEKADSGTILSAVQQDINSYATNNFILYSEINTEIENYDYTGQTAYSIIKDLQSKVGGELEFNNFVITLKKARGKNNGYNLEYGYNLTGFQLDYECASTCFYLFPYATYEVEKSDGTREKKILKIGNNGLVPINQLCSTIFFNTQPYKKALPVDLTGYFKDGDKFDDATLLKYAKEYMSDEDKQSIVRDDISISVSHINLGDTIQYSHYTKNIEGIGTKVNVKYPLYAVNEEMEVVETEFDVLHDRYNSIGLSRNLPTLSTRFKRISDSLNDRQSETQVWCNTQTTRNEGLQFCFTVGGDDDE